MSRAILLLLLVASLPASAVPIAAVRSAVGEADVRNHTERAAWMPQLAANLVFASARELRPHRAIVPAVDTPLDVQVTTLRPGETRLLFADLGNRFFRTRASFLNESP